MTQLFAMAVFALVTSISPGPVNIIATVTGANCGYIRTIPHITGATIGFVSILFLLGFGLAQLINEVPYLTEVLTYIGGCFLLYLAYKVAMQKPTNVDDSKLETSAPSFIQGMLCQWLNPKAWIVSLAGISVFFSNHDAEIATLLLFCVIFFVVCYASISVWAVLGITIRTILDTPIHYKLFNLAMGLLLAITVIYTFFMSS
ncbi:LysE family translocator [Xenorhabdus szentirmaii]|uniref:Transporter, LysE family n=2 Tax=Xenorhabdus szentirmaii TaxID=290112 RepID=W1J2H8_9GAMM|nr:MULTISPECIES: LysE family translocator [Xenorhabdus]MBD2794252.1 LysE family translocator [Xenorhabdus sp. CUL]MBD2801589.1 LysE family translocator [Xenorhabdus sp. M]MBD2806598.1 LysE family translocator [Xenorhabdus sp. ZM]MBD2822570.1 LysE family translocator [Xenorhabdus sp. 42]MBD2826865.1 LysE family translocator [Xenorhabdus sp. 5]